MEWLASVGNLRAPHTDPRLHHGHVSRRAHPLTKVFQVGLTRDFLSPDGSLPFEDIGLHELATNPAIRHCFRSSQSASQFER